MVVLESFLTVIAVGAGFWILGEFTGRFELIVIAGVIVLGIGGAVVTDDLEYQVGESTTSQTVSESIAASTIENASAISTLDVAAQDNAPTGVEFSSDGSKMFVSGTGGNNIYAYDTGVFDISITSFNRSFDVSGEDSDPTDVSFNSDGTRMYVTGASSAMIYQYQLSEAFNISTASLETSLDVAAQDSDPRAMTFNGDGTLLFMVGSGSGAIYEYSLSEPYNVSTGSLDQTLSTNEDDTPTGISFQDGGSRMIIVGRSTDQLYAYDLGTSFEVSTAVFGGESLDISGSVGTQPAGIDYTNNGFDMFVAGENSAAIVRFDTTSTTTEREESTRNVYEEVDLPGPLPIGLLVMLGGFAGIWRGFQSAEEEG